MDDRALVCDVEHGVDAANAETESYKGAEFDDFGRCEVRIHPIEHFCAHLRMSERKPFRVFDRQAFSLGQGVDRIVLIDGCILSFGDCWLRSRRSSGIESNGAGVDLRDSHSSQLLLAYRQRADLEHRL